MSDVQTHEKPAAEADWATDLAITIIADVHRYPYAGALELVAARLRLVEQNGKVHAAREAERVVKGLIAGRAA